MQLQSRPVTADDIKTLCSFAQDARELFYMFPKAQYPLTEAQLADAIAQRFDSTVIEAGNRVVGFANFYRAETGGVCCIGNVIVACRPFVSRVISFFLTLRMSYCCDWASSSPCSSSAFKALWA